MMRALQILSLAGAVASFIGMILIGNSITKDVNEALGTDYNGIWSLNGNKIWKEHERLFPANRKRAALAAALVAAFGLFFATAFLAR
jgi:4-amino-4-deoxy-L-arabinose transferase-like glycosyltransferase